MLKSRRPKPREPDYRSIGALVKPVSSYKPEMKIVFYGPPGTGKTTLAATFPKPMLFIDVSEKGTDSVRNVKEVDVLRIDPVDEEAWNRLDDAYWYLRKGEGRKYKSVAIDTVTGVQDILLRRVLVDSGEQPEEGKLGGWGTMPRKAWGTVASDLKSLIFNYRELPGNIVFIAHDRTNKEDDEDEGEGLKPQVGPRIIPSVASTLEAAVGIIGYTFIRERFKEIKIGKKTKKKRFVDYCLRLGPHAYYITKARKPKDIECPDVIVDPDFGQLLELVEGE